MYLIALEELRNRLGLPDVDRIDEVLDGTLSATSRFFEGEMQTRYDYRADQTDLFLVTRSFYNSASTPRFSLKLRNGHLTEDPTSILAGSTVPLALATQSGGIDLSEYARYDLEKGLVYVDGYTVSPDVALYVAVTYSSGFQVDSNNVYDGTPSWLQEAAFNWSAVLTSSNPVVRKSYGNEEDLQQELDNYEDGARSAIRRHRRYFPEAFVAT